MRGERVESHARNWARAYEEGRSASLNEHSREVVERAAQLVARRNGAAAGQEFLGAVVWGAGDSAWLPSQRATKAMSDERLFRAFVVALVLVLLGLCARDFVADLDAAQAGEVAP
jgi:hypothetical protein